MPFPRLNVLSKSKAQTQRPALHAFKRSCFATAAKVGSWVVLGWVQLSLPEAVPVTLKLSLSRAARTSRVLPFMFEVCSGD